MPHPDDHFKTKTKRRDSRKHLLVPFASLFFAIGAFSLTHPGVWAWFGASCWFLTGLLITVHFIRSVTAPSHLSIDEEALRAQMQQLDLACESLLDQNWELREAEQKYKALLSRQGDIILHLDGSGDILYANEAFGTYFEDASSGSPFRHVETEDNSERPEGVAPGKDPLWEAQIETSEGPRWFRWTETLVRSVQKNREMRLVIARDITVFKQISAASEAKSRFLATISHEMRTPLNGIIGMANLLESTALTPEQANYSHALRQSGTALLALVNDVLDLSRIEAGKLVLTYEWSSPARLMEDVVELLAPDAQDKGLSIASWISPHVPTKLLIDPVRVRQILINLLGNAIKFTPAGAVNLALDCQSGLQEGDMANIILSVRDTGPGIEESLQAQLFEEFEQADTTRSRQHEGTGLGLAISRRLARMMDGDIELESKTGKGSTFTLHLPAAWLDDEKIKHDKLARDATLCDTSVEALRGQTLVGIDLTEADRRALFAYCRDWGLTFQALSLSQWHKQGQDLVPDHLLINGAEPDKAANIIAGFDPLRGARLTRPLPRSRIILLEPGERRVIPQMRDSGISAYLVKPVRQMSLQRTLLGHPEHHLDGLEQEIAAPLSTSLPTTSRPLEQSSPTILLVEDNEINALLARTVLEKAGMNVCLITSGNEALTYYQGDIPCDLALLDLHMPDMDGMQLFDMMEAEDRVRNRQIPKIAFTADALAETRELCHSRGFDDFIGKPVDPNLLVQTVKQSLLHSAGRHKTEL